MPSAALATLLLRPAAHPNDLDRKRIERALEDRARYRYVSPTVAKVEGGYRISSPCCSRKVDPTGGIIDVARLIHLPDTGEWQLFAKNHGLEEWRLHSTHPRLADLLALLNEDPERIFWQ
ncbi:hypothetical protein GCM10007301_09190 [Azorhizobium oxalatiphilum]|uniref:DUF3024 domain-containing protein n=1 Tax=Azorhizobium oxalatiphilum TaxID=980631 RepID=A0A917BML2_9HYPH|nr:DUF3024 domain-containing protein [Azorhizobium oxalatiphilum]GGF51915.1 hypothetical protein GCM10007301_09190 [Azorhizobium oxalatiphilum]